MSLVALVLAAGKATRFGGGKLSAHFRGEPLLFHAIRAARAAPVVRVIVVAAPGLDCGDWIEPGPPVDRLELESSALSASLQAGVAAAGDARGTFVFLGDMPLVPHGLAARLTPFLPGHYAVQPRIDGKPGHPVLLSASAFPDLARLTGDEGAGRLLRARGDVAVLDVAEPGALQDVDRPENLAALGNLRI